MARGQETWRQNYVCVSVCERVCVCPKLVFFLLLFVLELKAQSHNTRSCRAASAQNGHSFHPTGIEPGVVFPTPDIDHDNALETAHSLCIVSMQIGHVWRSLPDSTEHKKHVADCGMDPPAPTPHIRCREINSSGIVSRKARCFTMVTPVSAWTMVAVRETSIDRRSIWHSPKLLLTGT